MEEKLTFELVPDGCWYSNLRSILSKAQWDFLRADAKERSNYRCAICGKKTTRLEAHERWRYDEENKTQILTDIIAVCKDCHSVIHIGRTSICGDVKRAEDHYMKVNKATYSEYCHALGRANETHQRLNQIDEWKLDLTYLKRYVKGPEEK